MTSPDDVIFLKFSEIYGQYFPLSNFKKKDTLVFSSLSSIRLGLSPKSLVKRKRPTTKVIGLKCEDVAASGDYGMIARVGLETDEEKVVTATDMSWRCSSEEESGWNSDGFTESDKWTTPRDLGDSIFTSPEMRNIWSSSEGGTAYCRKKINHGQDPNPEEISLPTTSPSTQPH